MSSTSFSIIPLQDAIFCAVTLQSHNPADRNLNLHPLTLLPYFIALVH